MALFKILKGQQARLPNTSKQGYAYYTTDKGKFYIFNSKTQRRTLNPDIKITIGNQTKTSTTLSPEVAFDLASIGAAAAGHNHDNRYLKLSGGTMTGTITLLGNQCADSYSGALNANNSNIYGVNSIYTADLADTSAEGIHFYRTNTTVDSLWIKNGVIYFTPNRTLGKTGTDYTVIHSGNYTDYTVKKDGAGASGNWDININKNAATATKLQTPRSLWGNSFDGSSDIFGNITLKNGDQLNMQGQQDGFAFNYWDGKTTPQSTRFYDGHANQIVRFASNGNVGIGTSNPTSKLQVNGTTHLQGQTATRTVRPDENKQYSLGTNDYRWSALYVAGNAQIDGSIKNLAVNGGIYWNPYVESTGNASDAASIEVIKAGVSGGTELRIKQMNDANDVVNIVTNSTKQGFLHNGNVILNASNYTDYTVKKDGAGASGNWDINAATATELQTARNINLGNDLQGGVSFNGTSDVTINASSYHCNVDSGNTSNYPWHRIARVDNISGQWIDRVAILDLHRKYNGGGYGRIKVSLRTSSTNSAVDISAVWLYRYGFAVDQIAIVQNGNTGSQVWADIYLKCGAYARTTVYQVEGDRLWTLVSSSEIYDTTTTDKKGSTEVYTAPGGARAGSKTVYGVDGAITLYSMLPYGFTTCSTNSTWGNTIGTTITSWNDSTGGSIDFRRDNPSSGKMSVKVDGRFYGNEGVNPASLMTNANGYWGIGDPDGNSSNWIRTTTNGLIPVQSGGQGNGHSALGTSSWYFKEAFIDNINGTNLYLRGQTGNRLIWLNSSKMLDTTGHYASGSKVAINSTSEPGYNFYVNGTSYFVNNVGIAGYNANYKLYTNGKSLFNGDIYLTNKGALIIYGDTVGNDVNTLISKTVGVLSYGDTGPKIDFGTSATGNQRGAIIFTDHDAAGAGVSWHFVSNQADWNVNSKRFVAKTSITIGQNLPNTNYNLYVNGSTYLNGILNVASTLQPTSTNTQTLGTSSLRWAKVYIGTADTYGSTTKGVYWNAGVPTAMTYELKSTVNNGIATRIAYYSGTNAVSSGSIVTDGSFLHDVSSLYVSGSITANNIYGNAQHLLINGVTWSSNWNWSGQGGQPAWLWGSNDGSNMYVWNPSNFSVYRAKELYNTDVSGTNQIYCGPNDAADGAGGRLNNLVISSWQGVSFTTSCAATYQNKTAVGIDCRNGHISAGGSLWISQNGDTGGGIHLADDGGFYNFNNGYGTAAFSSGLIVARGKDQNNTAINLSSAGRGWAYSSSEAQFAVQCDSAGDIYLYANGTYRGIYSTNVGPVIMIHNDNTVHMSANAYHNKSDIRLKQNIFNLKQKQSVNFIRQLQPVKFQFKHTDKYCFGFIAQDVLKVMKNFNLKEKDYNLVTKPEFDPNHPENERYYNISYTELIAPTIKAVQYLDKQIEQNKQKEKELQQQILKLKSQIQLLNAKLDTLVVSHL